VKRKRKKGRGSREEEKKGSAFGEDINFERGEKERTIPVSSEREKEKKR